MKPMLALVLGLLQAHGCIHKPAPRCPDPMVVRAVDASLYDAPLPEGCRQVRR